MWKNGAKCWNCGDKECGMCNVLCDCGVMSYVENYAQSHHIAYATFFITTTPHHWDISHHIVTFHILHYGNIPHTRTPHSTLHHIPHDTFCISIKTPCLKLQHSILHIESLHHITPTFHLAPHHAHNTTLSHSTHRTLHFDYHSASQPPCLIKCQTIPHRSVFHNLILHQPHTTIFHMYHTTIPHRITTFHNASLHDITCSITSHIFYISRTLLHITATLGCIRHNIPLQNIPHHTKFHTILATTRYVMSDLVVLNMWCGMMWDMVCCAGNVGRCEILLSCGGEMWPNVERIAIA